MAEYTDSFTSTMMSQIDDELMCGVCLELYDTPTILPCGHNFCKQCIEGIIRNVSYTFLTLGAPTAFKCPVCKARVNYDDVRSLPTNRSLESIVRLYKSSQPVDIFDKSWHTDMNISSSHCSEHNRPMDQYCAACALAICGTCAQLKHSGHHIQKISDVTALLQEELTDILADLKKQMLPINNHLHTMEQLLSETKESEEAVLKHLDSQIAALISGMKSRRNDLAQELSLQNQSLQKPVRTEIQRCRSLKEATNQIMSKLSILRRTNPSRKIQLLQRTCAELKTVVGNDFKEFFKCYERPDPVRLGWTIDTLALTKCINDIVWRKPEESVSKDTKEHTDLEARLRSIQHSELERSHSTQDQQPSKESAGNGLPISLVVPLEQHAVTPYHEQGNESTQETPVSTSSSSVENVEPRIAVQVDSSSGLSEQSTDHTDPLKVPFESSSNSFTSAKASSTILPDSGNRKETIKAGVFHTPQKSPNAEALAKFVARRRTSSLSPSVATPTVVQSDEDDNKHRDHKGPVHETDVTTTSSIPKVTVEESRHMRSISQKHNKNTSVDRTKELNTDISIETKDTRASHSQSDNKQVESVKGIKQAQLEADDDTGADNKTQKQLQTPVRGESCDKRIHSAFSSTRKEDSPDSGVNTPTGKTKVVPKFTKQPLAVNLDFNLSPTNNTSVKNKTETFV
ncbi:uncharacterized protein LOC127876762 [Dreissena polymorpha]|uniref:Uncharacterized protein n=1 Tax=Dreissena polymorpha TaxID=45954 RepID=A0A9D4KPX4_DREPO|nr:uncharacterized protein LOC127876762 [Dreissena polymorpha]XP_052278182.1 uncharacterized protein LOC127876762 [Dreissena polymorpha]XP_052278183.1 uncharacterized protein LOC127876762 [Dreissena polymorpha]KAH3843192.1 hypothetical protein DPMN_116703 [Dreissena polymorpha]